MATDTDLATIGRNIKRASLVQQAKVNASQARAEAVELGKFGWSAARSDDLELQIGHLEKLVSTQSAAREDARVASENLSIALEEGQTYVRKLRAALRPILRALPKADTTKAMFKADASLHNSAANLSAYLTKIRPGVEHLVPQLQAVLAGSAPLDTLDQLRAKIDATSTAAALARNKIPELTQAMNEAKGRVLLDLRDLLQFARVAFDAEPQRMGKFYLDLITGRTSSTASTVTDVTPPATSTPAGTASMGPATSVPGTLPTPSIAVPLSLPMASGGTGGAS